MKCTGCEIERETKAKKDGIGFKLPRGWKDHHGYWCPKCWRKEWVTRAATIAVAGPVDGTWEELRAALRESGNAVARVANLATRVLLQGDIVRLPDMEKLPPYGGDAKKPYLYPVVRNSVPELDTSSVTSVLQRVEADYRNDRFEVIWLGRRAPRSYRSPQPIPIHRARWTPTTTKDGRPAVSVRVGARRWLLRLRGGREWRRQLAMHRQLTEGKARQGELQLIEQSGSKTAHRNQGRKKPRLLVKMVVTVRRRDRKANKRLLVRASAEDRLWTWSVEGSSHIERYAAARAARWIAAHKNRVQRAADDHRHEKRMRRQHFKRLVQENRDSWIKKHHRRMDSWIKEAAAHLVFYAKRNGCAEIAYDDTDQSYGDFPWSRLWIRIEALAHSEGIVATRQAQREEVEATEVPEASA